MIAARHAACGEATRVRLPGTVPARAVRRLHCSACAQPYETDQVEELGFEQPHAKAIVTVDDLLAEIAAEEARLEPEAIVESPAAPQPYDYAFDAPTREVAAVAAPRRTLRLPKLPSLPKLARVDPQGRGWRLASVPLAGALVIAALLLLQGGSDEPGPGSPGSASANKVAGDKGPKRHAAPPPSDASAAGGGIAKHTKLIQGSSYSLALPAGWERINPPGGATFAAVSGDLGADATLWIEEDAGLDFPTFINQSVSQLEALAGTARVIERVPAPTPEGTIVRLAADAPPGQASYEVTLRAAGPYRFYLATSVQPDASREAVEGAELVAGSFTPEGNE